MALICVLFIPLIFVCTFSCTDGCYTFCKPASPFWMNIWGFFPQFFCLDCIAIFVKKYFVFFTSYFFRSSSQDEMKDYRFE